ncbi:MAG TPA: DNA primase [Terriglobales bacterium]|nr:DNA primase [Terriglobales bacterium]
MSTTDFKEQLRAQADIVRIVGDYVPLRKSGAQNYQGVCPFHKEKTPSFSVHATRQFYHCFGCGDSGDVFKFVQKIENITFGEAIRLIAQKLGVPMPKVQYDSPAEARQADLRRQLVDINERACAWFQEQLRKSDGTAAREYLTGRGLTPETIAKFRIGFAPETGFLLRDALRGQFDEEIMKQSGLFSWKQDDRTQSDAAQKSAPLYSKFRNRIMFPIMNDQGRVIAFTGRTLSIDEKAGPKYLNSPETPIYVKSRVLFNLDKAKEAIRHLGYAILVEGQMDCISVYAAGFHNVIASSGTAFTDLQAKLLGRFTQNIVVNFDPDTAGATATERTLALLVEEDFTIKVLTLEQGFDPDLFIRKKGAQEYATRLKGAPRYFDYLIERAQMKFPVRTPEGKVKAVNFLLPHIQKVPSRIARDELANEISQKLGIDSGVLRQELKHAATNRGTKQVSAPTVASVTDAERIIIRALAGTHDILSDDRTSSRDGAEEEFDPCRQARFALEHEPLHHGLGTESLVNALLVAEDVDLGSLPVNDHDRKILAECLMNEEEPLTPELMEGAILALRRRHLERQQRELRDKIVDAERKNDSALLAQLLRQKVEIDRALAAHVRQ